MVLPNAFVDAARRAETLGTAALGARTSLRVGGLPQYLFEPTTEAEAAADIARCRAHGIPLRYLGAGFNLIVPDGALEGAVLATRRLRFQHIEPEQITVGAGVSFPGLVKDAIDLGIPGLPGCPGIPGSVGGVVFMNAGGRFGAVADGLTQVRYLDAEGAVGCRTLAPGDMGYRTSPFGGCLVTSAVFRRDPAQTREAGQHLYDAAMTWKRRTQPLSARSAGCIFKNPTAGVAPDPSGQLPSAGRLIDAAGCKDLKVGGARVSPVHANFIENVGPATAADMHALIALVQERVRAQFGVLLELEVRTW